MCSDLVYCILFPQVSSNSHSSRSSITRIAIIIQSYTKQLVSIHTSIHYTSFSPCPAPDGRPFQTILQHIRQPRRISDGVPRATVWRRTATGAARLHPLSRLRWDGERATVSIPHNGDAVESGHIDWRLMVVQVGVRNGTLGAAIRLLPVCGQHSRGRDPCGGDVRVRRAGAIYFGLIVKKQCNLCVVC